MPMAPSGDKEELLLEQATAVASAGASTDHPEAGDAALAAQVRQLLSASRSQAKISQVFLYDARGSELYEGITKTSEYYLTKNEHQLLVDQAGSISSFPRDDALSQLADNTSPGPSFAMGTVGAVGRSVIELGAGSGLKTRVILDEIRQRTPAHVLSACPVIYAPIDVSQQALDYNVEEFADLTGVKVVPILGTVASRLQDGAQLPGRRTWLFLGSSLGNYTDEECVELFSSLARVLGPRDRFLVGVDTPHSSEKPASKIERAYNDAQGITAEFTINALAHVNRVAALDFDISGWKHSAVYDPEQKAIITHLVSLRDQVIHATESGDEIRRFATGEKIFVEQSRKFDYEAMAALAANSGLLVSRSWALQQGQGVAEAKTGDHLIVEYVVDAVERSRERARWIMEDIVGYENLETRPVTLRNSYSFYRGHLPAFSDLKAVQTRKAGALPNRQIFREAYERGIDPDVDDPDVCHWHSDGLKNAPDYNEFTSYAHEVAAELKSQIADDGEYNEMVLLALEHELMHVETLLYLVAEQRRQNVSSIENDADPLFSSRWLAGIPFKRGVTGASTDEFFHRVVPVPAGWVQLGLSPAERHECGFAWDNESPAKRVHVAPFQLSSHPVTNAEFAEFVIGGGYKNPEFWGGENSLSWKWLSETGRSLPEMFRCASDGSFEVMPTFHKPLPIASDAGSAPAWVTLDEARAFCAWFGKGARIMTEAEYHRCFGTDETALDRVAADSHFRSAALHGNNDFKFDSFTPVGSRRDGVPAGGVPGAQELFDLVGNGWEWTATEFAPFDGFTPLPSYPDYSADFFDGKHFVLKGAGVFTDLAIIRRSFRNWFQARYPFVQAKFRVAYDA